MQQVLFHIPIFPGLFGPEGLPIHGFGAMLFVTFVVCMAFAVRRGRLVGISADRIQDMCIVLLVSGIAGARALYLIVSERPITIVEFFAIWEGGIVFYGSIFGGILGYIGFYYWVLRPLKISTWVVADIVAPTLALGLMLGRFGCLLNGCCYGQVACAECASISFPLLTGPARDTVVSESGYQTELGFSAEERRPANDPRTVVARVEPDSQARAAGLKPGDKILSVNGEPNGLALEVTGSAEAFEQMPTAMAKFGTFEVVKRSDSKAFGKAALIIAEPALYLLARDEVSKFPTVQILAADDCLNYRLGKWPKGHSRLQLVVERGGQAVELPAFTPRSLGLQPTQLYESISMGLMVLLLLAFYPFRRHDGQVMVLLMFGYSVHRFLNEMLRNDTKPIFSHFGVNLTTSMTISILVFAGAIVLEVYLQTANRRRGATVQAGEQSAR